MIFTGFLGCQGFVYCPGSFESFESFTNSEGLSSLHALSLPFIDTEDNEASSFEEFDVDATQNTHQQIHFFLSLKQAVCEAVTVSHSPDVNHILTMELIAVL